MANTISKSFSAFVNFSLYGIDLKGMIDSKKGVVNASGEFVGSNVKDEDLKKQLENLKLSTAKGKMLCSLDNQNRTKFFMIAVDNSTPKEEAKVEAPKELSWIPGLEFKSASLMFLEQENEGKPAVADGDDNVKKIMEKSLKEIADGQNMLDLLMSIDFNPKVKETSISHK